MLEENTERREKRVPKYQLPHKMGNIFFKENYFRDHLEKDHKNMHLIHTDPNIFLIDHFLTESELKYFDQYISESTSDFRDSFTEDNASDVIYTRDRTSKFCFITKSKDHKIRSIESRVADLTGISSQNIEPFQIIHYTSGQQFTTHHDAGTLVEEKYIELLHPRRLATLVVYLNDLPFPNGFTEFPKLNLSILPKRGQALLFCNILPNGEADLRVIHKALPVHSPLQKYGLNIWISEKEMPSEVYELHKKKRKASEEACPKKEKCSRLELAQRITSQFYEKQSLVNSADLYFVENHPPSSIWKGKNYFLNLQTRENYDIQEKTLVRRIMEENNISWQTHQQLGPAQSSRCPSGLYFSEEFDSAEVLPEPERKEEKASAEN